MSINLPDDSPPNELAEEFEASLASYREAKYVIYGITVYVAFLNFIIAGLGLTIARFTPGEDMFWILTLLCGLSMTSIVYDIYTSEQLFKERRRFQKQQLALAESVGYDPDVLEPLYTVPECAEDRRRIQILRDMRSPSHYTH